MDALKLYQEFSLIEFDWGQTHHTHNRNIVVPTQGKPSQASAARNGMLILCGLTLNRVRSRTTHLNRCYSLTVTAHSSTLALQSENITYISKKGKVMSLVSRCKHQDPRWFCGIKLSWPFLFVITSEDHIIKNNHHKTCAQTGNYVWLGSSNLPYAHGNAGIATQFQRLDVVIWAASCMAKRMPRKCAISMHFRKQYTRFFHIIDRARTTRFVMPLAGNKNYGIANATDQNTVL